jgi:hypothetical protein
MAEMRIENLIPIPTSRTTPMMIPEHNRMTPVETMFCAPAASASRMSRNPILVFRFSQLKTTIEAIPTLAAYVGVNP